MASISAQDTVARTPPVPQVLRALELVEHLQGWMRKSATQPLRPSEVVKKHTEQIYY